MKSLRFLWMILGVLIALGAIGAVMDRQATAQNSGGFGTNATQIVPLPPAEGTPQRFIVERNGQWQVYEVTRDVVSGATGSFGYYVRPLPKDLEEAVRQATHAKSRANEAHQRRMEEMKKQQNQGFGGGVGFGGNTQGSGGGLSGTPQGNDKR